MLGVDDKLVYVNAIRQIGAVGGSAQSGGDGAQLRVGAMGREWGRAANADGVTTSIRHAITVLEVMLQ